MRTCDSEPVISKVFYSVPETRRAALNMRNRGEFAEVTDDD